MQTQPPGFWTRAVAKIIDLLILYAITWMFLSFTSVLNVFGLKGYPLVASFLVLAFTPLLLYFPVFLTGGRKTPGFRLLGLRLITADGQNPPWWRTLIRTLLDYLFIVLSFLIIGLFAYLPIMVTRSKQGLHDMISGTRVEQVTAPKKATAALVLLGLLVVNSVIVFGIGRQYFIQAFYITSQSMLPTLQVEDRLLVNKLYYRLQRPQRGDIIAYNRKFDGKERVFLHRLIGLPGETVEVRNHTVYINGKPLDEPYITERPNYDLPPTKIPEGRLFVLGDNRNNSNDSRAWGTLDQKQLLGRVMLLFTPTPKGL